MSFLNHTISQKSLIVIISLIIVIEIIYSIYMHKKHWKLNKNPIYKKLLHTFVLMLIFPIYINLIIIRRLINLLSLFVYFVTKYYKYIPGLISAISFIFFIYIFIFKVDTFASINSFLGIFAPIIITVFGITLASSVGSFVVFVLFIPIVLTNLILRYTLYPIILYIEKKLCETIISSHFTAFNKKKEKENGYRNYRKTKKEYTFYEETKEVVYRDENKEKYILYCSLLGVPHGSTKDEIKRLYHKKISQYHPDVNPSKDADSKTKELNIAKDFIDKHFEKYGK